MQSCKRVEGLLRGEQRLYVVYSCAEELWDLSNSLAESMGMKNYPTLSTADAASWAVDAWQTNVLSFIRASRVRIILVYAVFEQGPSPSRFSNRGFQTV